MLKVLTQLEALVIEEALEAAIDELGDPDTHAIKIVLDQLNEDLLIIRALNTIKEEDYNES